MAKHPISRILILGGYGGFGARLTRRLVGHGHHVLVAGRNADKAAAFCAGVSGTQPVVADRNGDIDQLLATHHPNLLIDAAGPFQGSDYRVPLACAHAAVPYIDLADARAYVGGIASLDAAARAGGVAIVAGASSVPALSGAVARHLARGMDTVRDVEIAISASNRATSGAAVVAAILSYVGKPLQLWRGRRWTQGYGWQELRRGIFTVEGVPALTGRWLALADVPDHDLMPDMLPGRPAVTFRAGTDVAFQTLSLWLFSWPVRWFKIDDLIRLTPVAGWLQRMTRRFGSDRSAMSVALVGSVLVGLSNRKWVERRWTLIADKGDGPEIPTLAAELLAEAVLAGAIPTGAHDASRLLDLEPFEPLFSALSVKHGSVETELAPPLYERVMGAAYASLPRAVREMHYVRGDGGASGEAEVERGQNIVARLIGWVMRFPPAGPRALHVAFTECGGGEIWTREFGRYSFSSRFSLEGGRLVERFGPLRFCFDLPADATGLTMQMRGWSVFRVPMPLVLAPRSLAREWEEDGQFRFDVRVTLPFIGLIVHYSGRLTPDR